ncbi:MAG: hypothetical protein FD175_2026 [Beijerinckiaceae bacterium]|nr:MAG: hypothetical protein FD175_2026 [Beijerinckiaceae bacterium]
MSRLCLRPLTTGNGVVHDVTPQSAGWTYVGFQLHRLADGEHLSAETGTREVCLVIVSGHARITADGTDFGTLGGRASPFEGAPHSVYIPAHSNYTVTATGPLEIAVCTAPGTGALPARVIPPEACGRETRGTGTNTRHVCNILPENEPAESLLVVEVITPGGNWSSYPPHKHDRDAFPEETLLEETYYHRLNPPQGYGVQRVYTDALDLDETITVRDGDCVLVPRGYHPVGAAHGYDLWYLNVMAGPKRAWRFHNQPEHAWLVKR